MDAQRFLDLCQRAETRRALGNRGEPWLQPNLKAPRTHDPLQALFLGALLGFLGASSPSPRKD